MAALQNQYCKLPPWTLESSTSALESWSCWGTTIGPTTRRGSMLCRRYAHGASPMIIVLDPCGCWLHTVPTAADISRNGTKWFSPLQES